MACVTASASAAPSSSFVVRAALSFTLSLSLSHSLPLPRPHHISPRSSLLSTSGTRSIDGSRSRHNFFNSAIPRRTMSTAAAAQIPAGKCEWLVVIPDKPGKQAQRLEVREQHLGGIKPLAESGFIKRGGALLNEKPEGADASKFDFFGSTLVCVASSREEVMEQLSKDIYAKSGVWDLDNVQIWPAKFAI
ncbi:hypothetical protein F5Y17DRAFT_448404 [Xylariaceae sp. FL0594]|nr:hypothetical protein F5Y17DRAFT_448404 [Xylariaceae sp. FL0594]